MRIAIIGTGNVGSALARGLKGKRHAVTLGVRDLDKYAELAAETGAALAAPAEAAAAAEIVILALPWNGLDAALKNLGNLAGKIVIDCTNPLGMTAGGLSLTIGFSTSGGETVASWLPGVSVVKTLNQVGAEIMANAASLPVRPAQFMAGNDEDAKRQVAALLSDLGFEALDAGGIEKSRLLEPFGMTWINQALFRGKGRKWALAAVDLPA